MPRGIPEGADPFAPPPPLGRRLVRGLAIALAVLLAAFGGLVWFRFEPLLSGTPLAPITVDRPAWGTATALPLPPEASSPPPAYAPAARAPARSKAAADRSRSTRNPRAGQVAKSPPPASR